MREILLEAGRPHEVPTPFERGAPLAKRNALRNLVRLGLVEVLTSDDWPQAWWDQVSEHISTEADLRAFKEHLKTRYVSRTETGEELVSGWREELSKDEKPRLRWSKPLKDESDV